MGVWQSPSLGSPPRGDTTVQAHGQRHQREDINSHQSIATLCEVRESDTFLSIEEWTNICISFPLLRGDMNYCFASWLIVWIFINWRHQSLSWLWSNQHLSINWQKVSFYLNKNNVSIMERNVGSNFKRGNGIWCHYFQPCLAFMLITFNNKDAIL